MLQEMFGDESVPKVFKGDKFVVTVDGKKANIDISALVTCTLITYLKFFIFLKICCFPSFIGSGMYRRCRISTSCSNSSS